MPTVERTLELARVGCYLADNNKFKSALFNKVAKNAKNQAILIYIYYKILNKIFTEDPTYLPATQQSVANYLYELLQGFKFRAAQIVDGGGGGQVVPVTPASSSMPNPYDWIVAASTSSFAPLADGDDTVTLDGTNGTRDFRGLNIEFYRGGQPQYTTNPGDGSTYYYWNRTTAVLIISTPAYTGEPMRITPVFGTATGGGGGTVEEPLSYLVGTTANAPVAGTSTWQLTAFLNNYVTIYLGGQIVNQSDMGDGSPYITKAVDSDTLTITNYQWQNGDVLQYIIQATQ